jgi:transposase
VYQMPRRAQWLRQLPQGGVRFRASTLYDELEVLQHLRPNAKTAMLTEAKRDPAWAVLRTIPYLGPVRVALLLATLQRPWRFRTKRHLWAYAGRRLPVRRQLGETLQGPGGPDNDDIHGALARAGAIAITGEGAT